jgi:hypothetical protein
MATMGKYGNVPTTVYGKTFHSKLEAERFLELRLLAKAGKIKNLQCQVKFSLDVEGRDGRAGIPARRMQKEANKTEATAQDRILSGSKMTKGSVQIANTQANSGNDRGTGTTSECATCHAYACA